MRTLREAAVFLAAWALLCSVTGCDQASKLKAKITDALKDTTSTTTSSTTTTVPSSVTGESTNPPSGNPSGATDAVAVDEIAAADVTFDESPKNIGDWNVNVTLSNVKAEGGKFSWSQTGETWKSETKEGWAKPAIGNVWVIAKCNGAWHAATWDWIGPGVRKKDLPDFTATNALHGPCLEAWAPTSGEQVCWMLSSFARGHLDLTVQQRSNIACTVWP